MAPVKCDCFMLVGMAQFPRATRGFRVASCPSWIGKGVWVCDKFVGGLTGSTGFPEVFPTSAQIQAA